MKTKTKKKQRSLKNCLTNKDLTVCSSKIQGRKLYGIYNNIFSSVLNDLKRISVTTALSFTVTYN